MQHETCGCCGLVKINLESWRALGTFPKFPQADGEFVICQSQGSSEKMSNAMRKGAMAERLTRVRPAWVLLGMCIFSLGLIALPDFLYAGVFIKSPPRFGPAPVIGAGLSIAGAVVGVIFAARRFRRRR